jgi:hypothetical protein
MTIERYTGQLYLAKSKPQASTGIDGTFAVQMLAYSRPGNNLMVPWRITYRGDDALGFWCHFGSDLVPGAVLVVDLTKLVLIEAGGRHAGAEMHARVNTLQVLPKAAKSTQTHCHTTTQTKPKTPSCPASH